MRTRRSLARHFSRGHATRAGKPLYVTTPIFYVNASPHLGHIYSMLLADTRCRWERLARGAPPFLLTGTDEHGLKIQAVAEREQVPPQRLVDRVSANFKQLAADYNVAPSRFIRTTDADHVAAVQHFWRDMMRKGLIYKGAHRGWYSVSDEAFYPESQIADRDGNKVSVETGSEVVFHEEHNYFFRLAPFQQQLLRFVQSTPQFVVPRQKHDELVRILAHEPLADLSVSRPSSRLQWGIAVPDDASQTIYVWFDALVNYLTAAGYPDVAAAGLWPASTHVVGKDIMRFHCIYWPIFLMAAGLDMPGSVVVHSHWLSDGVKMSKSLGNVVEPLALAAHYGADATRFYLMERAALAADCRFSESDLASRHAQLVNKWANICSRLGGGGFDLRAAVRSADPASFEALMHSHGLGDDPASVSALAHKLRQSIDSLYAHMDAEMQGFGQMKALSRWWETVELANEFFQAAAPWAYAKKMAACEARDKAAYAELVGVVLYLFGEAGRVSSICVQPFMPTLAARFLDRWSVAADRRTADFCAVGADRTYGFIEKSDFKMMAKVKQRHS